MSKNTCLLIAALALLLTAACGYEPDGSASGAPPGAYASPGASASPDGASIREQLIDMGYPETELDTMEASGISLERILNQSRFYEYADKIMNNRPIGPSGMIISPQYAAGVYFNENGILTVTVLDEAFNDLDSTIAINEMLALGIIVKTAVFNEQELLAAMDAINQIAEKVNRAGATGWGLDTKGNRVNCYIDPYTDEQIALVLELLREVSVDPAMIAFKQAVTQEMHDRRAESVAAAAKSPDGLVTLVGEAEVSRTDVSFSLENCTETEFCYGAHWDMAFFSDGLWIPLNHIPGAGGGGWPDILYTMQSGETKQFIYAWVWRFGELGPGRYMILIDGWFGNWSQHQEPVYAVVEFDITADSPIFLQHMD